MTSMHCVTTSASTGWTFSRTRPACNVAVQYAARYPERVSKLVLITPSIRAVGIPVTGEARREIAQLRKDEPWFAAAFAALEAVVADEATDDDWEAIAPFYYGRWDAAARAHHAAQDAHRNDEAASAFGAVGAFDPDRTRAAITAFGAPVLLLAGEVDLAAGPRAMAEFAELFPHAELVVQPGGGHYPWLDDPGRFVATTAAFLGR